MISTSINRILLITIICFSTLASANHSVKKSDSPYQGNVVVGSSSEAQLKNLALQQVLIKVSGNAGIINNPEAKLLLRKSQQLISQYGYRQIQNSDYFSAVFDKNKINQALKDMQQPVWGDTRPSTLIWLVNRGNIVSDNFIKQKKDPALSVAISQGQLQRGIHVQFPLMDLDDNIAISSSDIKGRFHDQVNAASVRYGLSHFISADLRKLSADRWRLSWQLLQSPADSPRTKILLNEQFIGAKAEVSKKMLNALADYYASQYAILENQGDKFTQTIHIDGINSLGQLAQLHSIFKNLLSISSYNIVAVQGEKVSVEVKLKGGLSSFKNTLSVEPHLQLDTSQPVIVEGAIETVQQAPIDAALDTPIDTTTDTPAGDVDNTPLVPTVPTTTAGNAPAEPLYFIWR